MDRKKPSRKAEPPSKRGIAWPRWTGFRGKTAWDWMQLLIVPLVLAVIGLSFTLAQQVISDLQEDVRQRDIEARQAAAQLEIEEQRAQNAALQTYLDGMRNLLLEEGLSNSAEGSTVRAVARAQTRSTLGQLSPEGKGTALQFLHEASLIDKERPVVSLSGVSLRGADLSGLDLNGANLIGADLTDTDLEGADLSEADLSEADLIRADLSWAVLSGADLSGAELSGADLYNAVLSGADLIGAELSHADLRGAILNDADLSDTYLIKANLSDTSLTDTNLSGANLADAQGVTEEQLQQAESLEGAPMPDGQKYED